MAVASWISPLDTIDNTFIRLGIDCLSACLKEPGHEFKLIDSRLLKGWGIPELFYPLPPNQIMTIYWWTISEKEES